MKIIISVTFFVVVGKKPISTIVFFKMRARQEKKMGASVVFHYNIVIIEILFLLYKENYYNK